MLLKTVKNGHTPYRGIFEKFSDILTNVFNLTVRVKGKEKTVESV